ncbi:unnamed protein product, partial [Prorocentrum cordatum]
VTLPLGSHAMANYDDKRRKGLRASASSAQEEKTQEAKMRAYCSIGAYFGSFHGGCKEKVLNDMASWAPKLFEIAEDVIKHNEKALVLCSRRSGLAALTCHLKRVCAQR